MPGHLRPAARHSTEANSVPGRDPILESRLRDQEQYNAAGEALQNLNSQRLPVVTGVPTFPSRPSRTVSIPMVVHPRSGRSMMFGIACLQFSSPGTPQSHSRLPDQPAPTKSQQPWEHLTWDPAAPMAHNDRLAAHKEFLGHGSERFQDQCKKFESAVKAKERQAVQAALAAQKQADDSALLHDRLGPNHGPSGSLNRSPYALCHNPNEQTPGAVGPAAAKQRQSEKWHGFRFEA